MVGKNGDKSGTVVRGFNVWFGAVFVAIALAGVGVVSRYALLSTLIDGLAAAFVVMPPVLGGLWLVPLVRAGPMPLRWHLLIGAALGLGATSLLMLLLGLAGILQRPVWVGIMLVLAAAGAVRLRTLLGSVLEPPGGPPPLEVGEPMRHSSSLKTSPALARGSQSSSPPGPKDLGHPLSPAVKCLWLLAAPFMSLALLAASNAPGFIWQEEGYGYDVLEYHLQMPKEYFHAGRIEYAPHNVYANFPANVEMLYLLGMVLVDDDIDIGTTANMIHLILGILTVYAAWVIGRDWSVRAGVVCAVMMATAGWICYLCGLAYIENGMLFFGVAATGILLRLIHLLSVPTRAASGVILAGVIAGFACGCKYTALPMIAFPLAVAVFLLPGVSTRRRFANGALFTIAAILALSPWLIKNRLMTGNPVFPLAGTVFKASPPGWGDEEGRRWDRGHSVSPEERSVSARVTAFWRHVPGDTYQRFGPALFLLALGGLAWRKRDWTDWSLLAVLLVQLGVWLFATHLYARFAVVLLIPLALLAGRAILDGGGLRLGIITSLVVVGCAWNLVFAAKLHRDESPGGAPASLIYEGRLNGYEYFDVVNNHLPQDAKILLVGDARAFYFKRRTDYCIVFNRNPFVQVVKVAQSDCEIVEWLHDRGYTHVLVNWSEIKRLRDSRYGFPPEVDEDLFKRLTGHGLVLFREFEHPDGEGRDRYVTLYEVPRMGENTP